MSSHGRFTDALEFARQSETEEDADMYRDQAWEIAVAFGKTMAWEEAEEVIERLEPQSRAARAVALSASAYTDGHGTWAEVAALIGEWRQAFIETGDQ